MVELTSIPHSTKSYTLSEYLAPGESVVIVDDSPEILLIFKTLLIDEGFSVHTAENANELDTILAEHTVALTLLDIGLPDKDGTEILTDIAHRFPDMGIIMLTGTTDLDCALNCLRQGADDYLAKPVPLEEFKLAVRGTLQKRRLTIDNRLYQKQLELTNYRTQFLHQLNLKMNSAYLNTIELDSILRSILVGITAEEGLKFNRAFLLLFNKKHTELQGKMALGPSSRADAGRVWDEIKEKDLHLSDILNDVKHSSHSSDGEINTLVRQIVIQATDDEHVLIQACNKRSTIHIQDGKTEDTAIAAELLHILQEDCFIATPLFSPNKSLGIIIADNFITRRPITVDDINSLEIFAAQASLAIEYSHLNQDMLSKIEELEEVTQELEKNKDLLIEAERYSAVGHMSAQLVHAIRNPITSIGGIARLLAKRTTEEKNLKFLDMMILESGKIESTLEDLFSFVGEKEPEKSRQPIYPLISKSIMLFYGAIKRQAIEYKLDLPAPEPSLYIDIKMIRQMLLHLIRNGVEAMPDGGLLQINCSQTETSVIISISDSGSGIVESNMPQVSDPYFTTKTYGTGMGLTLVEKIIAEHQGSFSLEHNQDGGMVATVTLPKAE